jgi:hypothetical protein
MKLRRPTETVCVAATCVLLAILGRDIRAQVSGASQEPARMKTHDDLLIRVEKHVPGFGGMFIDSNGQLAVYLLDTAQLEAARSAVVAVFGPSRVPAAGIRAIQGQYAVSQLKAWTERAGAVLKIRGVTMVDLDEAKNRVKIGVESSSQMPAVEKALSSLSVPRKAVSIDVTGPIRPVRG